MSNNLRATAQYLLGGLDSCRHMFGANHLLRTGCHLSCRYLYWFPGNTYPMPQPAGWYVAAKLGSDVPLSFVADTATLPTPEHHISTWMFKTGVDQAWQEETTVTSSCALGDKDVTHDYHGTADLLALGSKWYGEGTCLSYSRKFNKCLDHTNTQN